MFRFVDEMMQLSSFKLNKKKQESTSECHNYMVHMAITLYYNFPLQLLFLQKKRIGNWMIVYTPPLCKKIEERARALLGNFDFERHLPTIDARRERREALPALEAKGGERCIT